VTRVRRFIHWWFAQHFSDELDADTEGINPGSVDRNTEAKLLREWKARNPGGFVRDSRLRGVVIDKLREDIK
jgi:hypothetical protein